MVQALLQPVRLGAKATMFAWGASVVALSALGVSAPAQAGVINFVDFEGLPFTSAEQAITGGTPEEASVLTNQFASSGVLFGRAGASAGVAVIEEDGTLASAPSSGLNSVVGLDASGQIPEFSTGDIFFEFVLPNTQTPAVTDFVSFTIGDEGSDIDTFEIRAFDLGNVLVNTQSFSEATRFPVNINALGINRVEVNFSGEFGYTLDDLQFSTPVPEPMTVAGSMVALAFGWRLRKLKKG